MNVDPSRDGIEPDIAFTGPNDTVPWVVWYEPDNSGVGLATTSWCSRPRAPRPRDTTDGRDGQFHWTAVGGTGSGGLGQHRARQALRAYATADHRKATARSTRSGRRRRGPAGAAGHDDPGYPTGSVGRVGRGRWRGPQHHRLSSCTSARWPHFVIANGGQPVENGRPCGHHVLRAHAVRHVA